MLILQSKLLQKFILLVVSIIASLLVCIILLEITERFLGINISYNYCCEPRPNMWVDDSNIGFRNKPNWKHRVFGNIVGVTNDKGFRSVVNHEISKRKGLFRVVGIGDSVMWGTRVNEEDSILGKLEHKFADKYIEMSKSRREDAQPVLEHVLKQTLIMLHPFIPFITEELYWKFEVRKKSIMLEEWPRD